MATNPYRDFGLHPDEFGSAIPSSTAPQPQSNLPQPNTSKPNTSKPSAGSFSWARIGMVLLAMIVIGVPKAFMAHQRQQRLRADRDRAVQLQQLQQLPREQRVQIDDPVQQAQVNRAVQQLNADAEAVRSGKKKAGEAFHRLFKIPQTPENTIQLPAAQAVEKEAE